MLRTYSKLIKTIAGKIVLAYSLTAVATTPTLSNLAIASAISTSTALVSLLFAEDALADHDPFHTASQNGQTLGGDGVSGFNMPSVSGSDIGITYQSGATSTINTSEIFPDAGPGGDAAALDAMADSDSSIDSEVSMQTTTLYGDTSTTGTIYTDLLDSASSRTHPDLSGDPALLRTESILTGEDAMLPSIFTGCSVTYTEVPGSSTHVPDLQTCIKPVELVGNCNITHDYVPYFVRRVSGNGLIQACRDGAGAIIPGCVDIWVGRVGNNYLSGWCTIYEDNLEMMVDNPTLITSAQVVQVTFDDYMIIELNGTEVFRGPGDDIRPASAGQFPPETCPPKPADYPFSPWPCPCELSTNWNYNPASYGNIIDVTTQFQTPGPLNFRLRTSVAGRGESFARIRAYYDPGAVVVNESWEPQECIDVATAINDGFCVGSYSCTDGPGASGCITLGDGLVICSGDDFWNAMATSPVAGIDKLCKNVDVTATCDWWASAPLPCYIAPCYVDPVTGTMTCPPGTLQPDGISVEVCPSNTGTSTCGALEADPSCAFVSSTCDPSALGASGECYAFEETYDCGYDSSLPGGTTSSTDCVGPVRCMGNECVTQTPEVNTGFGQAAATAQAMQFAAMDSNCVGSTSTGVNCEIFKGEYYNCKRSIGGITDCCVNPGGPTQEDYMDLANNVWDAAARTSGIGELINNGGDVKGAWKAFSEPATVTWDATKDSLTSAYETVIVGVKDVSIENAVDIIALPLTVPLEITTQVAQWVFMTYGGLVMDALFIAGSVLMPTTLEQFAAALILGFSVYAIIKIIVSIVYACEDREYEAMMKRELGACVYIDDWCSTDCPIGGCCLERKKGYCCFNTPLARIVMSQVKNYSAMNPKAPDCSGLTMAEMTALDWSTIDLTEWTNTLSATNTIPSSTAAADASYSMDATSTNDYATFDAPNAADRAQEALNPSATGPTDIDNTRDCIRQDLWGTPTC